MYEQQTYQYTQGRPGSSNAVRRQDYQSAGVSQYGWNPNVFEQQSSYGAYAGPPNAYTGPVSQDPARVPVPYGPGLGPQQQPPQGYSEPNLPSPYGPVTAPGPSTTSMSPPPHIQAGYGTIAQGGYAGHQPNVPYSQQGPTPYPAQQQPQQQQLQQQQPVPQQPIQPQVIQQQPIQTQATQQQPVQAQPVQTQPVQTQPVQTQPGQAQPIQAQPIQAQPVQAQPVLQATQAQPLQQQPTQPQPVQQQPIQAQQVPFAQSNEREQSRERLPIQTQPEVVQEQPQPQARVQASSVANAGSPPPQQQQQQHQQQQQQSAGPPYIYDPNTTYANPNVQAWAQYYAQGGKDLTGSVYFISIPGLTDHHASGSTQETGVQQTNQPAQLSQYQQPQQVQDQPHPQARRQPQSRSQSHDAGQNPYTAVNAAEPKMSSPTSTFSGLNRGNSLSASGIGGVQAGIENAAVPAGGPIQQPVSSTTSSWGRSSPTRFSDLNRKGSPLQGGTQLGIPAALAVGPMQPTTSATPSWVLPKKTPPATVAGAHHAHRDAGGNLLGQFGGISLSDGGVRGSPPNQGAGTLL